MSRLDTYIEPTIKGQPTKTYELASKSIRIIRKSLHQRREQKLIGPEKQIYIIYRWVSHGKNHYDFCTESKWNTHPGRNVGIILHEKHEL